MLILNLIYDAIGCFSNNQDLLMYQIDYESISDLMDIE